MADSGVAERPGRPGVVVLLAVAGVALSVMTLAIIPFYGPRFAQPWRWLIVGMQVMFAGMWLASAVGLLRGSRWAWLMGAFLQTQAAFTAVGGVVLVMATGGEGDGGALGYLVWAAVHLALLAWFYRARVTEYVGVDRRDKRTMVLPVACGIAFAAVNVWLGRYAGAIM